MNEIRYNLIGKLIYCCEFDLVHRPISWVSASSHVLMLMTAGRGLLYWKTDPAHPLPVDGKKNDLYYLPPNSWRFVDVSSRRPAHIISLHFEFKCEDGADFSDYYSLDPVFLTARKATFRRLLHEIARRYCGHDFGTTLECERYFRILQGYLCETLKPKKDQIVHPKPMHCRAAVAYLQKYYHQTVDVHKLAELCNLSKPYFFALFRQETGMTAKQYLLRLRIEQARKLLLFSTKSVAEISQEVGWNDPFHFSRLFARETGVSPTGFRHQQAP